MAHSVLTSKGQVTIPKKIREKLNLNTGDRIDFKMEKNDIKIVALSKKTSEVFGMLQKKNQKSFSIQEMNGRLEKRFKEKC